MSILSHPAPAPTAPPAVQATTAGADAATPSGAPAQTPQAPSALPASAAAARDRVHYLFRRCPAPEAQHPLYAALQRLRGSTP